MGGTVRIELFDGYFIDIDDLNYSLKQKYMGKSKDDSPKESERILGYFSDIPSALAKLVKISSLDVCDNRIIDLKEYAEAIEGVFEKIKNLEIVEHGK